MVLSCATKSGKRNCEISHFQNLLSVDYITIQLQQKEPSVNQVTRVQEFNLQTTTSRALSPSLLSCKKFFKFTN